MDLEARDSVLHITVPLIVQPVWAVQLPLASQVNEEGVGEPSYPVAHPVMLTVS